jgi:ElaB/YqjD/DUF883 family membrane-anchored ribosome-binding protein
MRAARSDARALRHAARDAARHARAAGNAEVEALIEDVEELIRRVGDAAGPENLRARERVAEAVANTREAIEERSAQIRQALAASDKYVRNQPWEAVGAAALLGLVLGFLVFRR